MSVFAGDRGQSPPDSRDLTNMENRPKISNMKSKIIQKHGTLIRILIFPAIISILSCLSCASKADYYLPVTPSYVKTGLEVFLKKHAKKYKGKNCLLITNHSGVNRDLQSNINLLREKGIIIYMVMAPEHGIYGYENEYDKRLYNGDDTHGAVIYNMHKLEQGQVRFLAGKADIVIFDIQDMGMRCYTYVSDLKFVMDDLHDTDKELIVLDRPDPIGYLGIDGAMLDNKFFTRFVSSFPAPFIYNMTMGEAALYYRGETGKKIKLRVIPMQGYDRRMFYHNTGLPWIPPSPNLPTYESAIIYSGMVLMEGINISLGRGTTKPFQYIGAPWIDAATFCRDLNGLGLKNFRFRPIYFEPTFSKYRGQKCGGAHILYTGGVFSPTEVSYRIIQYILKNYRYAKWEKHKVWYSVDTLAGTDTFRTSINEGKSFGEFQASIKKRQKKFLKKRKKYTLY